MLLPYCLLLSTLIYKKTACLTTNSSVLSVLKSNSVILSDNRAGRGGGYCSTVVHQTMVKLSDLSINLVLKPCLRADFKAKMAKN